MEKINIAELLKDCKSGMELDCTMFENLYFNYVDDESKYPINCYTKSETKNTTVAFTAYGKYTHLENAKCVIFPKGKTTWEDFHRPFKDGEILSNDICICLYNGNENDNYYGFYVGVGHISNSNYFINQPRNSYFTKRNSRLATEKEKQKLFKAIKDNGYKWNPVTKTLEKLNIQKFKDGDIVTCNDRGSLVACIYKERKNTQSFNHHIALYKGGLGIVINGEIVLTDDELSFATEEEKERLFQEIKNNGYKWNVETKTLDKSNKPIFKVGQKIKIKNGSIIEIREITDYYYISTNGRKFEIKYQDNYELMPNKFDISSLIPFESKVLVRSENHNIWKPAIFGFFVESNKNFYVLGGTCWTQCIPYKGNEYLFKTTDDCNEYYKTWEK